MRNWFKALLVGALALGPAAALAAIDNTHHDIPYMRSGVINEKCAYCHSRTGVTAVAGLGKVGGFCVAVCHVSGSGLSGALPNIVPTSAGTFTFTAPATFATSAANTTAAIFTTGHGMSRSALGVFNATEETAVGNTGWPYTQLTQLECTSCHSVHDADNPPYLNARLTAATAPQTNSFCQRCHTDPIRVENFAADAGDHPTEFQWNPTAAAARLGTTKTTDTGTVMNNRDLVIGSGVTNLNVTATGVANGAAAGALNATTAHWNLGGHVLNTASGLPTDGTGTAAGTNQFGCYSCHTVHTDNNSGTNGLANLILAGANLRTVCYGCHTTEPGTTGYGHPIDFETTRTSAAGWPAIPLTPAYTAITATFRPATGAPWCVSCHDVHGAIADRMAIRNIAALNTDGAACELCHAASFANPTVANAHHPGATGTNYATTYSFPVNLAWVTTDGLGDLDDGLSCPDCHVGDGTTTKRGTAHNWR